MAVLAVLYLTHIGSSSALTQHPQRTCISDAPLLALASWIEQIELPHCLLAHQSSSAASGESSGSAQLIAQPESPLHTPTARQTDLTNDLTTRQANVLPWQPLRLACADAAHEARLAAG